MPRGVRLNPQHDERTRAKIQTSQIINQLMKNIKGEIEMSPSQVRSAEILLKKTLPDLAAISIDATMTDTFSKESVLDMLEDDLPVLQ